MVQRWAGIKMANVRQKLQGRWKSVAVEEKQLSGCSYRQRLSSKQHQPMHLAIRLHRLSLEIRAAVASAHLCPQPSPFPFPLPTAAKIIVIVVVVSAQVTEAIMLNTRRRVHDKYCIMLNYTRQRRRGGRGVGLRVIPASSSSRPLPSSSGKTELAGVAPRLRSCRTAPQIARRPNANQYYLELPTACIYFSAERSL